ncbi:hypothetical protein CAC42_3048 [Sphaceloma murrayae]|uniref:Enhancer of mRNA-decapping protein 3 n=1 Tax=Sphaceloma murrayae TaxID=2082308 RepID=A0A2K1QS19_9PEZI|nr:hypothetical protein CAC42_3048 [Sphaceloma murrayae]
MAEAFIGMTVCVKLKPGSVRPSVTGKVINIHDQTLHLEQVYIQETGETAPSWTVPSYQIADLEVVDSSIYQPRFPSGASTIPIRIAPTHADPAILSYARPLAEDTATTPTATSAAKELPADVGSAQLQSPRKVPASSEASASPVKVQQPQRNTKKGKGWRQTPLLEETVDVPPETPQQIPSKPRKPARNKKSRRLDHQPVQNGWATEDATDVQDMGDFDFEANLSKFDKQAVFNQIRIEDTTADEDRLVSHNRLARPGTYGGKNLHPTENVLSPPTRPADDKVESPSEASDLDFTSGRNSRQSLRSRQTKQSNSVSGAAGLEERSLSRALRSVPSHARPLSSSVMSSNSLNRSTSSIRVQNQAHSSPSQHHFKILESSHHCPLVEPGRLRRIEQDYARRPGLSNETLIELTGRAIAEDICNNITKISINGPSRRNSKSSAIGGQTNRDPKPVIVILAGNHPKGARAVAAARHLYGRGYKLLLSLSDFADPPSWHPVFNIQVSLLQSLGRKAFARLDSWPGISAQIKKLSSPPALIVDALLDGVKYAAIEDVQVAFESRDVVDWMNRSRARVVSLECPSGYDSLTGETTSLEGEPLAVKPDRVLALGGMVSGVGEAMKEGDLWSVTVLDVGLSSTMRSEETIRFEGGWSVDVQVGDAE